LFLLYTDNSPGNSSEQNEKLKKFLNVKILTEADLPNYTIYDILMPLPGTDVKFPEGPIKAHFQGLLTENGYGLDDFERFSPR